MSNNTYKDRFRKNNKPKKIKILTRTMKAKLIKVFCLFVLVFIILGGRIYYLHSKSGEEYAAIVLSQQDYTSTTIPYKRGDIYDRNGNVLATSVKVFNLILDPYIMLSKEDYLEPTLDALCTCFGYSREELRQIIYDNADSRYVIKDKQLEYEQIEEFENILADKTKYPDVKGVWFEEEYKRKYPYDSLACSTIGFTVAGDVGNWGIEECYNDRLRGTDGRKYGYVNEDNTMDPIVVKPTNGESIVSTIDIKLQSICEKYIQQWVDEYHPKNVAVAMADPNTGEILAMASSQNIYNLNSPRDMTRYFPQEQIDAMSTEEYLANLSTIWRNYCISDSYEAGSTIKPFTIGGALEDGKINKDDTFLCDGGEQYSSYIHCHKRAGHGTLNVEQAIMNSCNDALMQIAAREGVESFCRYQEVFGFGMRTGIDLPGEASCEGLLFSADKMGQTDLACNSFGQNFNVTMVQMMAGFSSLINGGYYYKPHVVKQILNANGGVVSNYDKELIKQTVTKDTSEFLKLALVNTVVAGTGRTAAVPGYDVGGKTGTAQHHDKNDSSYLLSFLGFAPLDNPEVVCYAIVDAPDVPDKGSSSYACKLFSAVMTEALPYMNIFPTKEVPVSPEETTEPETESKPEEVPEETTVAYSPSDNEDFSEFSNVVEPEGEDNNSDDGEPLADD